MAELTRSERIARFVLRATRTAARKADGDLAASVLPAIRAGLAEELGGDAALYYGTADPVYYREIGATRPITRADGTPLVGEDGKVSLSVLRASVRRRRDAGGRLGRWNVLASSASAALGRPVSEREVKALYVAAGRDLSASYTGRGTRAGATATREDAAAALPTDA